MLCLTALFGEEVIICMGKPVCFCISGTVDSRTMFCSILEVMPKPVFRRLQNGELKLDYTEVARKIKLSRQDVWKDTAEKKSLTAEEVGMKTCELIFSHFE